MTKEIVRLIPRRPIFPQVEAPLVLMRHMVTVSQPIPGSRASNWMIGKVVTHLSIQDWCQMKGYKLLGSHPGSGIAMPFERTDLL